MTLSECAYDTLKMCSEICSIIFLLASDKNKRSFKYESFDIYYWLCYSPGEGYDNARAVAEHINGVAAHIL